MSEEKIVRIANAQGFWGDSILGPMRMVEEGPVDYLTFDYLAEISMSIMQKQKQRNPEAGYAADFLQMLEKVMPTCQRKGIKIIANAGGVNLAACLEATKRVIRSLGLKGVKVGIVEGDDILHRIEDLVADGEPLVNLDTGNSITTVSGRISSANVYIGADAVVEALREGADIVITGRVADPSLTVAPLIYEFGWSLDDYDKIAAGTVMGHLLECGTQCTGGVYTDWKKIKDFARMGFPVCEAKADGSFVVTKHENTGGLVSVETVTSQLLYELGDPKNYLSPDCIADFTSIQIAQVGENRVSLSGIKGRAPCSTYKVSASYENGYKIVSTLCITGPDAVEKARLLSDVVFERMAMLGADIPVEDRFLELIGTNVLYEGLVPVADQPHEILMRLGAKSTDKKKLEILGKEIAPLLTSGPPGLTGYAGGRAKVSNVVGYWPALISRCQIKPTHRVEEV